MDRVSAVGLNGRVATAKVNMRSGLWFVVLGSALWGVDPLFRILLLKSFTSTQIVLIEHVLLLVYALPVVWLHRQELRGLKLRHLMALLFISWGGSALATILFTSAFAHGNPNAVLLLQKLQPLFAIILARIVLKESLPRRFALLLILALLGTYLLTFGWKAPIGHWGDIATWSGLLSIGAAALWGGSTVMGRLMLGQMKFETVTALRFLLALPLLVALSAGQGMALVQPANSIAWGAVIVNLVMGAFIPGLLSLLLYYRGLTDTKASYATLAELSFPAVGLLINWLVFQQAVTPDQLVGFVIIWAALFGLSRQSQSE